jgi:serine/alanine adding enzyme
VNVEGIHGGAVKVALAQADIGSEWDSYVDGQPRASLYHYWFWRELIREVFGHETQYWHARDHSGRIVGILPIVEMRSVLFGSFGISMPFFNYGGAIGDRDEIESQLMASSAEHAPQRGLRHVEYRDSRDRGSPAWQVRTDKVVMELVLPDTPDSLWQKLGSKLRAQVKRPMKENVRVVEGRDELVRDFYAVFARNMRDLGTPVYPQRFFTQIVKRIGERATILVAYHLEQPVAAGVLLRHRTRMEIPWASSLREFNQLGPNMLLYWSALKLAIEKGCRTFDFGRSTVGAGTFRFKQQWGARPVQLHWHYWMKDGGSVPKLNPDNPKFRLAIETWRRLPLAIANRIGPLIAGRLP